MDEKTQVSRAIVSVPTPYGTLRAQAVEVDGKVLLVATSPEIPAEPIVRFHSSCVFGEGLHAEDCDCGVQLDAAVRLISRQGGVLVYAWEEGRGTGIANKIRAIALQQLEGVSTAEAFQRLGFVPEPRDFAAHIHALRQVFGGDRIRLASNNPEKISALKAAGYKVERIKLDVDVNPEQKQYLDHKRTHLGHLNDD